MTRLDLPGYRVVVPSSVYSRNSLTHSSGDPGESIIVAERYIESSREQIEARIKDLARRMIISDAMEVIYTNSRRRETFEGSDELITMALSVLPYNVVKGIAGDEEVALDKLRASIDPKVRRLGTIDGTSIYVRHGIVSINQLALYRQKNHIETHDWYHEFMPYDSEEGGSIDDCWSFMISVIEGRHLPPRQFVDMMIQCNSSESDLINFTGLKNADRRRVETVLDAIYSLVESQLVSILPDVSSREFLEMCIDTLGTLIKPSEKFEAPGNKFVPAKPFIE